MKPLKLRHRVTRTRVKGGKLPEFGALQRPLWIRRVLVRAQEGQLEGPIPLRWVGPFHFCARSAAIPSDAKEWAHQAHFGSGIHHICFQCAIRVAAMNRPSGDTRGVKRFAASCVSWRGVPPAAGTANSCMRSPASSA
jgi:hypothetical protein